MKKIYEVYKYRRTEYAHLVNANKEAVDEFNTKTLMILLLMGWVLSLLPLFSTLFTLSLRKQLMHMY